MSIFTIGDLHLSFGCNKPMDVFFGWEGYVQKLAENWDRHIKNSDTVVLLGDTSWAMKLLECEKDFEFLQSLPGKKILIKGNHDYWWTTLSKMKKYTQETGFDTLDFLHNNFFVVDGLCICGTRSWMYEPNALQDAKVMAREATRLRASLQVAKNSHADAELIAFLHYPPLYPGSIFPEIIKTMEEFGVKKCYYAHLHGPSIGRAVQGIIDGIEYKLVSSDALKFMPLKII